MDKVFGKWKLLLNKTVGVDDVGKLFGWTEEKQKAISSLEYTLLVEQSGDKIRCLIDYGFMSTDYSFTFGEPFDFHGADGTQAKCTVTLEDGKITEKFVSLEGVQWQIERTFDGTNMESITSFEGSDVTLIQELIKV